MGEEHEVLSGNEEQGWFISWILAAQGAAFPVGRFLNLFSVLVFKNSL